MKNSSSIKLINKVQRGKKKRNTVINYQLALVPPQPSQSQDHLKVVNKVPPPAAPASKSPAIPRAVEAVAGDSSDALLSVSSVSRILPTNVVES